MISIIIPTYNHCQDLLRPCLESIVKYTSDFEVIVVANGCTDDTAEYMKQVCSSDSRFTLVWSDAALGYTKATNLGIKVATGNYIVLMNNDTVLLEQPVDLWIKLLLEPFNNDSTVGVTGPVKFSWFVSGIKREAMAFWLVMISKKLFNHIGILDEIFSPGMGEDGDFCIRAVQAGYKLVSVPTDITGDFNSGIINFHFPIWHKGNGTFADDESAKFAVIDRNNQMLEDLFGIDRYFLPSGYKKNDPKVFNDLDNEDEFQKEVYQRARTLCFSNSYMKILDIGCGSGFKLKNYFEGFNTTGIDLPGIIEEVRARYPNNRWLPYIIGDKDRLLAEFDEEYDLIICSDIIEHLMNPDELLELIKSIKFKKLVISTPDRFMIERRGGSRLGPPENNCHVREWAFHEFKRYIENSGFKIEEHFISNESQATQLIIASYEKPEITIIVPTYNHFDDAFKPGIDAVLAYTNLSNKEVIVVANGCAKDDLTRTYLEQIGSCNGRFRYIWVDEPAGYVGAINIGVKASVGKYIVLLDNDSHLMSQPVDMWIDILKKPFLEHEKVGATSPFAHEYVDLGFVVHSGCTMYDGDLLRKLGGHHIDFSPGYFSDADTSMRIWKAGYKCIEVPVNRAEKLYENGTFLINFPVIHTGMVQTMDKTRDADLLIRNRARLYDRHGKKTKLKYSIVIPTYNHCDDLLKPCIESIFQYTTQEDFEIIVVANGCIDNTREYLATLPSNVKSIWFDEAIGYTRATNAGIKEASAELILLLNNDTELLKQPKDKWINMIAAPFNDPEVGLSGPLMLHDDYANFDVIIFFCAMIRKSVFEKVGYLDEIFSPGGGEDIDFAVRTAQAGYKIVPTTSTNFDGGTNVGGVPIWHKDNRTFRDIPEYTNVIVKRNGLINCKRYNQDIKLNLGSGGIPYKGYLSVDLYDERAHVQMDITKLDFDDNSVTEILASHVFEHLNPYHSLAILKNWLRVLKPGGKLIMEMPDIEQLCRRFTETKDTGVRYGILNAIYGSVNTTGVGGPDNITSPHLFGWWPQSLWDHLSNAGFVDIQFMEEKIPHPESNLRVEAVKPNQPFIDHDDLKRQEPATYIEIFNEDSYNLAETDLRGKMVIDVGANLGMFALRCLELGARRVIAVEAQPVVYTGLIHNVSKYPRINPLLAAVWDKDGETVTILNEHVGSKVRSGEDAPGHKVGTITLKTLIDGVDDNNMILKLDCEGSEFNILLGTEIETIRKFESIHIEIHSDVNENPAYKNVEVVRNRLRECGFNQVSLVPVLWFNTQGHAEGEIGVYVEKWVRV